MGQSDEIPVPGVRNMENIDTVKDHATLLAATMVQVYKEVKTLPSIAQVKTIDGKIVNVELPDELLIQASIASVGMANKENRMVRNGQAHAEPMDRPQQAFKPADKLPPPQAEDMSCPLCGEAVKTRTSTHTGKPYMYCDNKKGNGHQGRSVFVNPDGTTKPMR